VSAVSAASGLPVDSSNAAQLRAWDGDEGAYWADHADDFDRSVAAYHEVLLAAAAITDTDRVLDIGCGTGQTTRDAARAAAGGSAFGVDLSARMLEHARRRAAEEGVSNASFQQVDAQVHPFPSEVFDVAISRTGAMFFGDLTAAFANIGRAMVPRGRLVLVVWQGLSANEWIREISGALAAGRDRPAPPPDAPGPFSLSDPARVHAILTAAGFADVELEATTAGMWFGADADHAHRFVLGLMGWMLDGLDDRGRARAVDALRATMAAHETGDGVVFGSAAWTIRATRA
jgi:SAM-dependent methyltransferase